MPKIKKQSPKRPQKPDLTPPPGLGQLHKILSPNLGLPGTQGLPSEGSPVELSGPGSAETKEKKDGLLKACEDLSGVFYEMWHAAVPEVPPLTQEAKARIARPLYAYLEETNQLDKFLKPLRLVLVYNALEVAPRLKVTKDAAAAKKKKKEVKYGDANHDSGEKEAGKDYVHQASDPDRGV